MLGGMFQSRLNANIREDKGYSYGVSSSFAYGKGPGAFRTGGDIVGDKTDAALVEFMKELRGILGDRPVTDEELATAKDSLIQRLPGTFASVSAINGCVDDALGPGAPGRLLPAVHEGRRVGDQGRRPARGEAVHRHRSSSDRDRRRPRINRRADQGDQHRADCLPRYRGRPEDTITGTGNTCRRSAVGGRRSALGRPHATDSSLFPTLNLDRRPPTADRRGSRGPILRQRGAICASWQITLQCKVMPPTRPLRVKFILPALTEATSPFWRPVKYSLFPPLGLATLAAYLEPDDDAVIEDEHVRPLSLEGDARPRRDPGLHHQRLSRLSPGGQLSRARQLRRPRRPARHVAARPRPPHTPTRSSSAPASRRSRSS